MIPYEYLVIEGNIGAGKTSLAKLLSADLHSRLLLEEFEDNPFLPKFYESPERYAFPLELSFLAARFAQLKQELSDRELFKQHIVADYFLGKSLIFANATLDSDEYDLFMKMYTIMHSNVRKPDLLVYLYKQVEDLQLNIKKRGRSYEQNIESSYLEEVQKGYFDFMEKQEELAVVVVDTTGLDFVQRKSDFDYIKSLLSQSYPKGITRIKGRHELF